MGGLEKNRSIPLVVIAGPTAVGKTAISMEIAKQFGGEIVSADSVQVYRYLDIGSAKPSVKERNEIPHHMVDVVEPDVNFTVYDYQNMARQCIELIYKRNKLPVISGGTGLYINAVIDEYSFNSKKPDSLTRERLEEKLKARGKEYLYSQLQRIDPQSAKKIHPNDTRRVIRALEFFYLTGMPISLQEKTTSKKESPYNLFYIGLTSERSRLYERINDRVDTMINKGLLEEVRGLIIKGYGPELKSLQSLGYKHMISYLKGKMDWQEAISLFKRDTRRYAKRQLTWFNSDKRIKWFQVDNEQNLYHLIDTIYKNMAGK